MEEVERILSKLDKVHEDVNKTRTEVGIVKANVKSHTGELKRHEEDIGKLYNSRDNHEGRINTIEVTDEIVGKNKKFKMGRSRYIIGILITIIIGLVSCLFGGIF
tara:strand:- start:174 stop:488 length:315 start_codon:yes stop_codon:yes gene_type:complete